MKIEVGDVYGCLTVVENVSPARDTWRCVCKKSGQELIIRGKDFRIWHPRPICGCGWQSEQQETIHNEQ